MLTRFLTFFPRFGVRPARSRVGFWALTWMASVITKTSKTSSREPS